MTTLFLPHAPYAEDQPYAKTILTFHVLRSGATVGAGTRGAVAGEENLSTANTTARITANTTPSAT